MAGIYVADLTAKIDPSKRRDLNSIDAFISSISPPQIKCTNASAKTKGFVFLYQSDKDVNFIYNPYFLSKLADNNLSVDLNIISQGQRIIIVPDICHETFHKDIKDIKSNIESQNSVKIIKLTTFSPQNSHRRYLKIYLENKDDHYKLLSSRKIKVFQEILNVEAQRSKPSQRTTQPGSNFSATHSVHTPSARIAGSALPPTSNWAGYHSNQKQQADITQVLNNEKLITFFTQASAHICSELSKGLENPYLFVKTINDLYASLGLPKIAVPWPIIKASRNLFLTKQTPPPMSPLSLAASLPHTQTYFNKF